LGFSTVLLYLWKSKIGSIGCDTGQYEEAIKWGEKAVRQNPNSFLAHIILTEIYSLSGKDEEARAQAAEVLRVNPKFSLEKFRSKAVNREKTIDALRKAGLK